MPLACISLHSFSPHSFRSTPLTFSLLGFLSHSPLSLSTTVTMTQEDVQNCAEVAEAAAKTVTFSAVKPQLFVEAPKANDAVLFYKAAFGAEEVSRTVHPKRKATQESPLVLFAELMLGSSSVLVSDLVDDSVNTVGTGFAMCLETEDVKAAVAKAVSAGAVLEGELEEGEGQGLVGKLKDPYGFVWMVCSPTKKTVDVEAA